MAGKRSGDREAEDHHHPDRRRSGGAALGRDSRGEHRQHRSSSRAGADADEQECGCGQDNAENGRSRGERRAERGADAAEGKDRHAADDPGRSPAADIGTIAPGGAQYLHTIMRGDEQAGNHRREREFDDHHAVDRRRHQHDDRAKRRLHEPQSDDVRPAERRGVHSAPNTPERNAKALTSMPRT